MKVSTAFVVCSALLLLYLEGISAEDFDDHDTEFLEALSRIRGVKENLILEHHNEHVRYGKADITYGATGDPGSKGFKGHHGVSGFDGPKGNKGESALEQVCT